MGFIIFHLHSYKSTYTLIESLIYSIFYIVYPGTVLPNTWSEDGHSGGCCTKLLNFHKLHCIEKINFMDNHFIDQKYIHTKIWTIVKVVYPCVWICIYIKSKSELSLLSKQRNMAMRNCLNASNVKIYERPRLNHYESKKNLIQKLMGEKIKIKLK